MKNILNNWQVLIIMCLTLGLAPFTPEPHIWSNLKWIAGGAKGMELINWADTMMHGTPWILLIILAVKASIKKIKNQAVK